MSESFDFCCSVNILCLFRNVGFPSFRLVPLCFVYISEGLERGFATFRERMAIVERRFFLHSVCARGWRELSFAWLVSFCSFQSQTVWHWWCCSFWDMRHDATVFKHNKNKYIDVVRRTNATLDVLLESRIDDYWNIDGGFHLSDAWTEFHTVHNIA